VTTIARTSMPTAADQNGVDRDLVARTVAGDREAYRVLVEKYQGRAFSIALEIVKTREDAEDIVQESFVKAYLSLGEFRGQAAFYTWLYRIVYNMAIDFKRRAIRRGGEALEYNEAREGATPSDLSARIVGPHEAIIEKEQRGRLERVLAELSPEHRAVVLLREVEGLSYDDIAKVTGVSKGTVMSRLHYARKALQRALVDMAPEGFLGEERKK
jgi:RNA polymerase sigma-70 factor (ECF subfamily)